MRPPHALAGCLALERAARWRSPQPSHVAADSAGPAGLAHLAASLLLSLLQHFDKDEHAMREEGRIITPIFGSILYLTGGAAKRRQSERARLLPPPSALSSAQLLLAGPSFLPPADGCLRNALQAGLRRATRFPPATQVPP